METRRLIAYALIVILAAALVVGIAIAQRRRRVRRDFRSGRKRHS